MTADKKTPSRGSTIAKNTLVLYFRMLFSMIVGFYTSRVILNTLGMDDFGIYNVVGGVVAMFSFLTGSIQASTSRNLTFELGAGNEQRLKDVFGMSITVHLVIAIIVVILSETVGLWWLYNKLVIPAGRLDAAVWVFHLSIVSAFLSIMQIPYGATIIAHEKMSAFAWMTILDVVLKLLICYALLVISFDKLKVYALLFFGVSLLDVLINVVYSRIHFIEARFHIFWEKDLFKSMISFAGWSLFGQLAFLLFTQGLNILLNMFFGPAVNASRAIAVHVNGLCTRFIGGFQTALNPQITKSYASGDYSYMHRLITLSSKFSFYLLFFLSLPVIVEADYLIRLWLKIVPDNTVSFFRVIILISLLDTLVNPIAVSSNATGNIRKFQIEVSFILLMILPVSYVALKLGMPAIAVFVVHFLCAVAAQVARLLLIRPMINLSLRHYFTSVIMPVSSVLVISTFIGFFIYNFFSSETWTNLIIVCSLCCVVNAVVIYVIGMNSYERNLMVSKLKNIILRKSNA